MKNNSVNNKDKQAPLFPTIRTTVFFTFCFLVSMLSVKANNLSGRNYFDHLLEGRWDLTLMNAGKSYPAWLEVRHSGTRTLVGQFVGQSGSARPISKINVNDKMVTFSIPPQWDTASGDLGFEGKFEDDRLTGTITMPNGELFTFTGVRAPSLRRTAQPVWGKQIKLFNGVNLKGWHTEGEKNQWIVQNGILRSPASGSNIMTDAVFNDFKLHIEFRIPKGSNSGIYLRGRYEVQIIDSKGQDPSVGLLGAIYGFLPPTEMMAKASGEWQSYDITLVGRLVTLTANGKTVICNQEIPGITGGALDSREGEPGPIMIQGDHGAIDMRNILITPAR